MQDLLAVSTRIRLPPWASSLAKFQHNKSRAIARSACVLSTACGSQENLRCGLRGEELTNGCVDELWQGRPQQMLQPGAVCHGQQRLKQLCNHGLKAGRIPLTVLLRATQMQDF